MDPAATEASSKPSSNDPRRRDLDRPRGADQGGGSAGRALHRGQRSDPGRDVGDRAVEPPLRAERRALHDGERAPRVVEEHPTTTPISFVLADNRLVTVRYATPKPVRTFENHARREPDLVRDARRRWCACWTRSSTACRRDRSADRRRWKSFPRISSSASMDDRRIPAARLTALADEHRPDRRPCSPRSAIRPSARSAC